MAFIERDGVRIHYEVHGSGPAILLTHGYSAAAEMWRPQVAPLSREHRLILWDMRGHGRSDYPRDPSLYSEEATIADMAAILDAVGASKSAKYHRQMREAGVQLAIYHPLSWWEFYSYNYRTHRKLLVIDGRTGFIGGVGIADEWDGDARSPEEWRDLHYRVEGPAVAQLQGIFASNWFETRKEVLQGPGYFPGLRPVGPVAASVFAGAPQDRDYAVELMYQLAIASARKSIYIESPYFIPGRTMVESFRAAASRGVDVQILMPGDHIDQKSVQRASRKRWPKLLEAGVKLFEYEPTMIHSKLMIVDGNFVTIGSANFDPRSLSINDEANMNVLDEAFAAEQTRIFFRDRALSRPVDPQEYGVDGVVELPLQAVQTPLESQL